MNVFIGRIIVHPHGHAYVLLSFRIRIRIPRRLGPSRGPKAVV
jgi:hypothetical protein